MEHRNQPLAPRRTYLKRQSAYTGVALGILLFSLAIGIVGYHSFEGLGWVDSLLNASMILGGMGPVDAAAHRRGQGLCLVLRACTPAPIFLVAVGIMMAPTVHRGLHWLQLEADAAARDGPAQGMGPGRG